MSSNLCHIEIFSRMRWRIEKQFSLTCQNFLHLNKVKSNIHSRRIGTTVA